MPTCFIRFENVSNFGIFRLEYLAVEKATFAKIYLVEILWQLPSLLFSERERKKLQRKYTIKFMYNCGTLAIEKL